MVSVYAAGDSIQVDQTSRSRILTVVSWPLENVIQPVFNAALWPFRPPLVYFMENNVLERGVNLITLGDHQQVMLYPTFNLKPGTFSSTGITYRHRGLLSEAGNDYWVNSISKFINNDFDFRTKYSRTKLFGTEMQGWVSYRYRMDRDAQFCVKEFDERGYTYADSSWEVKGGVGNPLYGKWDWEYQFGVDRKLFDLPSSLEAETLPATGDSLLLFDRFHRGFYQNFWQFPLGVQLMYNSKNFSHAPTQGQLIRMLWQYVPVSHYGGASLNHDFYTFNLVYQTFFLIGKKQYTLTRDESKANKKYLQSMNLDKTINLLSPDQLRETLLERKVIALQFRMRQMWDADLDGLAPFTGFSEINGNTPLRGYERSYFDYNTYGLSLEYRWPLVDLVDGVVFNEYGIFGRDWKTQEWGNLRNSWGFGIRVRRPNLFLTRMQFGFHGLHGVSLIMTINPEFQ
jgi:outer membrane protein assembly factor BamA